MKLIVGLGNPESAYADTRHNLGFQWVNKLAGINNVSLESNKKFFGLVGKLCICSSIVWLLNPMTYMNKSGTAVGAIAKFYGILPQEILVIHDELDLFAGEVRLKFGGGSAGHNGLKDIMMSLGSRDFWRIRLGIGRPMGRESVSSYVLRSPSKEENLNINRSIERSVISMPILLSGDSEKFKNALH